MSPRSFGIAILLHAALIGVAMQQWSEPEPVQPQAAMSVTANVQAPSAMPQPQSSPAPHRAWPAPELELPGDVPAPDQEIIPEPEPEPTYEPQPEFKETVEPTPRETVIKGGLSRRFGTVRVVESAGDSRGRGQSPTAGTVPQPVADRPRSGVIEGFPTPDTPPRILNPSWPRSVRENYTGSVQVKVVVGADGRALRVELVKGTGNESWDDRMLKTFKEADYTPGVHHGMVLITSHTFRVHFRRTR